MAKNGRGGSRRSHGSRNSGVPFLIKFRSPIFWLSFSTFIILFLLPVVLIYVGEICPNVISSQEALSQLYSHISFGVGIVSLVVGIISIIYSYHSNKTLDAQTRTHEVFMCDLRTQLDSVIKTLGKMREESGARGGDMCGKQLQDPEHAREKSTN